MRKTRVSQLRFTAICRALAICAAYFAVTGCNDDTFDQFRNGKDATLAFQVSVPEKWTDGKSRAEAIEDVSIVKLDSDCEEQLYLITAVSSVPDSVVEMPASRGAVISEENFYSGFGLSAICYTGSQNDFDASGWTTNFARNIKMTKSNDFWQPTDNKLEWMGSGRVRFYAYAPYGADVKSDQGSLSLHGDADVKGTPELDFVLADDVKKQVDLLTAIADCDGSQGGNVTLNFRHALTAVTVKTGDNMLAGTVKEVSFSNIQSKGRYTFPTNITDPGKWTCSDSKKDYTITLDKKLEEGAGKPNTDKGQEIVGETGDLTLLMIPQTLDASSTLTIKFIDALSGKERTLTASLGGNSEWKAGTRVAYSINTSGIYVDPVVDFDFQVVKPTNDTSIDGNKTPITKEQKVPTSGYIPEFKIHAYANVYQLDESSQHVDEAKARLEIEEVSYSLNDGAWKSAAWEERNVATTSASEDAGEYRVGSIILEPRGVFNKMREKLYANSVNGSAGSYHDLSKGGETANCYMVNAPGYYSFPMVYGNANPNDNKAYYTDKNNIAEPKPADLIDYTYNNPREMVLENFVGYDDKPVKEDPGFPYISGVKDAVLVWQDSPDLVREISVDQVGKKVCFQVDKEAINQGNAVIAVRNAADEIMWSWHIWVTDKDWGEGNLHPCTSKYDNDNAKYILAPHNLGYCDPHDADSDSRIYKLKIKVKLPDGTSKEYESDEKFEQYSIEASNAGDNTYYQWGRKDPILPGIWNEATIQRGSVEATVVIDGTTDKQRLHYDMDNKPYYPGKYKFERVDYDVDGKTIGESIQMPYAFFMHDDPYPDKANSIDDYWKRHWHNGSKVKSKSTLMNYWDSEMPDIIAEEPFDGSKDKVSKVLSHRPTKTIYDPCPAGFCVPNGNAFTFMGKGGQYYYRKTGVTVNLEKDTNSKGWIAFDDNGKPIVFPSTGLYDFGKGKEGCITYFKGKCRPAHARLTFLSTSSFQRYLKGAPKQTSDQTDEAYKTMCLEKYAPYYNNWTGQVVITYIDDRTEYYTSPNKNGNYIRINGASSNSYGCSVRPIKINW